MAESIFFWDLPDLKKLCAVRMVMNVGISQTDIREKQVKLCRSLLLLFDHIVASPLPEDFREILVIMSITFFKTGKLQIVAEKQLQIERPERVNPSMLQTCLFYTITMRLAPNWNKAGHLLIYGADFLTKSGKQDAVSISINVLENQLVITVQVHTVRLAPCQLCDFDVPPESTVIKKNFSSNWCYVLPSMKMGNIVNFSRDIPAESPFKSYKDFQNYWKTLYGYELPHMSEGDVIYCSVYFKFIAEKLFTYPLVCLRSQPFQFYPRAEVSRVLNTFIDDLNSKMPHLCGFQVNITNAPVYPTNELTRPVAQDNNKHLNNLTSTIKLTMAPETSAQPLYSVEITQSTISLDQSLECFSENVQRTQTLLNVEHITSLKVIGSQDHHSSCIISSAYSGSEERYVPFFSGKARALSQKDNMKSVGGHKTVVKSNIFNDHKRPETFNSVVKGMHSKTSFVHISDAKKNTPNNKTIQMNSSKEESCNTILLPCPPPPTGKQPCMSASLAPGKEEFSSNTKNVRTFKSGVFNSCKLNFTDYTDDCISHKGKKNHSVAESVKISNIPVAEALLHGVSCQEEKIVVPLKKCKINKTGMKVDVEQHARDNKLFKLNNADLQDWLKQHDIPTRTRERKEQLVAKIMQFIQQS